MSLIASPRHTAADLRFWAGFSAAAVLHANGPRFRSRLRKAESELLSFTGSGQCLAGVSWGKDSTVIAHMIVSLVPRVPIVWVRVDPDYNPDCILVRDAFLQLYPGARYDEITVKRGSVYRKHGTLIEGMKIAARRYGNRRITGVRGSESGSRSRRMKYFGFSTGKTCAPIGHWNHWDVFGYLLTRRSPIHPAYACTMGGKLDMDRGVRVSPLGGDRGNRPGDNMGRLEWERAYYRREIESLNTRSS